MNDEWNRKFRKGFTGSDQESTQKPKKSYTERLKERLDNMTPEERAERQRKIESQKGVQSYENGGQVMCSKGKKNKLAALSKLSKYKER
jgi:hypothetical protein